MNNKKYLLLFFAVLVSLSSCQKFLDKGPTSSITPNAAFGTATDLQLYVNSFYNTILPSGASIYESDNSTGTPTFWGGLADNTVGTAPSNYVYGTITSTSASDQWNTWSKLRNVNYFLQNYNNPAIGLTDRQNYSGIAHFFRAYFYYGMVKLFGNVPWFNTALDPSDTSIFKPQDPRTLVMDSVLADLNYACQNISATKDNSCSMVTKWTAYALKSRVCLYEGTYRKYHTELGLTSTAGQWLQYAAGAADTLIASGQYKLHTTGSPTSDYRALFISTTAQSDEVILAANYSSTLNIYHAANWWFTSPTYGNRTSFTKDFIDTYLDIDGTRFTDKPQYDTLEFQYEVQNRDARLFQTIRMAPYTQSGTAAPPDFTYTYTGYEPLKFCVDNPAINSVAQNANAVPIFRYAEVLLNDAEAYAELGQMTQAIWNKTIAPLRARAGITGTAMPATADTYIQHAFYPDVTDPVILEIRRERGVELSLEGFRYDDIRRWKEGNNLTKPYKGLYVPALNQILDLNQDGHPDVCFVTTVPPAGNRVAGVVYYLIDNNTTALTNGTYGNLLWLPNEPRVWADYKYYYPISYSEIQLDPELVQNQGW